MLLLPAAFAAQPPGHFLADVLGAADGLATAMVYGVTVGPDDRVYVATERGVSRFDGAQFTDVLVADRQDGEAAGCYAVATLGGTVWAQCTDGVYALDGAGMTRRAAMVTSGVRAGFGEAPDGTIWVASSAGLWTVRGDDVRQVPPEERTPWTPRAVQPDAEGAWVGAAEGLFRLEEGRITRVGPEPVRAFLPDPQGLLVGREDGLFRIDGTPVPLPKPCYVTGLARAPDGRALVACGAGAFIEADGAWERFGPEEGLPGVVVRGVAGSADGTLWFAVWKRGLVRLGESGVRLWAGADLGVEPIADLAVEDGRLVVAGWDGAWALDAALVPSRLPHPKEDDRDFASIEHTKDGQLVVATADAIWARWPDGWRRTAEHEPLWDLARDHEGRIWASDHDRIWTHDGSREVALPHDGTESVFSVSHDGRLVMIGASRLWTLTGSSFEPGMETPPECHGGEVHDVAGERWLVCVRGAFRQDGAVWTRFEGFEPGEELRAGANDGDALWVSTSAGRLVRVRPAPLALDRVSGLPKVSFLSTRGLARFGDWLVAATAEGVLWVRPDALARPRAAPEVRIDAVESRGRVADPAALGPEDTFLRVHLGLGGVVDPVRTRYRFRLDGGEWSSPVTDPTLQLPGLTAGDHALEAAAATAGSDWGAPATLAFTVPMRWWERVDVRLGFAALLASLAWVFWQERHRRVVSQLAHAREMESVRQTFGRFVTPEVAEEALAGRLSTRGEAREVTVVFADLRGFTPLTASMDPRELVDLLNAWLSEMVAAIEAEGGVVNKFIGDAVVAIFGAPRAQPDHAARALRAATRMAAATRVVAARYGRGLRAGVGVNSGVVIAGPVGAASRMEYTVIGEVVNVAARVEALTRTLDADVLVAEDTVARLGEHRLRDRGTHALKGVAAPVRVWEAG